MRAAMLISALVAASVVTAPARADDSFKPLLLGNRLVYIVPQEYAEAHSKELIGSIPGPPKVEGFWTPSETSVEVAERVFREYVQDAAKDPGRIFPELEGQTDPNSIEIMLQEKGELASIVEHYPDYAQQYVGLIIDKTKIVYCNYAIVPNSDPSGEYIYVQYTFADDGTVHFLQAEVDPFAKTCSHMAYIGAWQRR